MAGWRFYLDGNEVEEPIGWDAVEFTAIRMESHGIDQPFSTELRFYNQGAKYIKKLYDQYFINAEIAIQIISDVNFDGYPYQFDGFLNLSIYEEHNVCDTDSWEITVGIIDDNFREQFKARQDIEVSLETNTDLNGDTIADLEYKEVRLHKQDLYLVGNGRNYGVQTSVIKYERISSGLGYAWDFPAYVNVAPCFWGNSDFNEPFGSTIDTVGSAYSISNCIFINNAGYTRTIQFNTKIVGDFIWDPFQQGFFSGESANIDFYIVVADQNGQNETYYTLGSSAVATVPTPNTDPQTPVVFNINNQINAVIPPNYRALLLMYWGEAGNIKREVIDFSNSEYDRGLYTVVRDVCVSASEINSGEFASLCNGLTIEQYLRRLIYIITGDNNKLLSDAFSESGDGCYWNNLLTNGLKIRNAKTIDQIVNGCSDDAEDQTLIKTSWKKTFDSLDKIFCLGWAYEWTGFDWKIRVEPREYFYQNAISQTFNNLGEVTQMAKVDSLVNNLAVGFSDKWKNIAISGAWAIHTDRNYFVANKAMNEGSSSKLDLLSDIIAEGYAIEFSRRLSFIEYDSGSSDRPNDYEIFIIWLNRNTISGGNIANTILQLPGETGAFSFAPGDVSMPSDYITASNSPLGGLYNIIHTPARVAMRWWKVLGMHTYGLTNPVLRYQVGEYQTTYSSVIDDATEPCQEIEQPEVVLESMNISPSILRDSAKEYLFKPIAIEFSYPQSLCDFLILSQNEQYKKVRLTSGSLDVQGFITQASNQPEDASGGTTKFTLLMSAQDALEGGAFTQGFNTGYQNESQ